MKRQPIRAFIYVIAALLSLEFVPAGAGLACVVAVAATELIERLAARRVISRSGAWEQASEATPAPPSPFSGPILFLEVAHILSIVAVAAALATIWLSAHGAQRDVALYIMAGITINIAVANNQVLWLLMVRQAIIVGTAVAVTVHTIMSATDLASFEAATPIIAVALFALLTLIASYESVAVYRRGLERESDLAQARDAAERADEGKSAFLATVSHELRTPLNGMLGMTQTLLQDDLTADQKSRAEVIAESGKALNALLTDILDFSKLEAGKLRIQPAEADLKRTIDEVLRLYEPIAESKELALAVSVLPTVPSRMVFDAVRVRQCLSNLISNALKFTDKGRIDVQAGAEEVSVDGEARWKVALTVRDSGIGIPADRQKHLFQPYSQADTSIATRFGGTGLGLSIVRQLAEQMGGGVALSSAPGQGAEFKVTFLAGKASPTAAAPEAPVPAEDLTGRRVLVVDDVQTNRMVMRLFLEPMGVEVVEAADAETALQDLDGGPFDVAFLDLHLTGMGGLEMARKIRNRSDGARDMPLVAVTADSSARDVPLGGDGFLSVIQKPVDHRQLQSALISALRSRG